MKALKAYLSIIGLALVLSCNDKDVDSDCKGQPQAIPCTQQYTPVCGCDGFTYSNPCSAQAAGVKRTVPGECGKK